MPDAVLVGSIKLYEIIERCTSYQLAAEERRVGWHTADNVPVHDVYQSLTAFDMAPTDVLVACSQVVDRITQSENADEFAVVLVHHQITQPPAESA